MPINYISIPRCKDRRSVPYLRLELLKRASADYVWFIDDDDIVLDIPRPSFYEEIRYCYEYDGNIVKGGTGLWSSVFKRDFLLSADFSMYLSGRERKEDYGFRKWLPEHSIGYDPQVIYHYNGSHFSNKGS